MRAAQSFSGHFLPRKYFGKRTLRQCAKSAKGDNIVLIEVDSDDFGDVIILDVPESLQEKFRKNQEHHVISIDDDDNASESRARKCDMADGATTSNRFSSASAVCRSNCANVNGAGPFVGEGSKPVKLSKSRRTYSGQGISTNRYGLGPDSDSESCSSESDDSDSELMEDSFGKLREEWEKASFRRRHDANVHSDTEDKAGPSTSNTPVHNSAEDGTAECLKPTSNPSNLSSFNHDSDSQRFAEGNEFSQQGSDAKETDGLFKRKHGRHDGSSDLENNAHSGESDQPFQDNTGRSTAEHSELPQDNCCFKNSTLNHEKNGVFSDFAEKLAEQSNFQQDIEAEETTKIFTGNHSGDSTKGTTNQDVESDPLAFDDSELGAAGPVTAPDNSSNRCNTGSKSSSDHNDMITDRQKIKETDEYKHAMEEEWASRQQQLLRQAEEARRLRNRKRAESMRIMDNARRQRLRLEEIRETRRKEQANLNLKEELRAEIRNQLHELETMCFDMASLLRALGIHVGGGHHPSSNEVQAAYKRACLTFHPDRLSTTDLRQQVEAEEKFKLISNMKDKFSLGR